LRHDSSGAKRGMAAGVSRSKQPKKKGYNHNDPSLKTGAGGLTVWTLQEMLRAKRFDELENMYNNGLNMNALPVGVAAGAGNAVLETGSPLFSKILGYLSVESKYLNVDSRKLVADALESFVGRSWRGKIFFSSNNKRVSKGRNRLRESLVLPRSPIVPMAKFDTMLLDSHPLAERATSNLVVLNYADPQTRPYWQELVASKLHAYDVQVAVKGKYGPI